MFKYTLLSGSHSNINLQNYIDINVRSSQFNPLQFFVTHSEVAGLGLVDLKKSACFSHSWATPVFVMKAATSPQDRTLAALCGQQLQKRRQAPHNTDLR